MTTLVANVQFRIQRGGKELTPAQIERAMKMVELYFENEGELYTAIDRHPFGGAARRFTCEVANIAVQATS
jgi:hypothetical protein